MSGAETVHVAYGKARLPLKMDPKLAEWCMLSPKYEPALHDAADVFASSCRAPIGSKPLRELISPEDRVVIVTSDGTRPVPNFLLIPWLLRELPVPPSQIKVLLATGTHRPNSTAEIDAMFGRDVVNSVSIVNHDAFDESRNVRVGTTSSGYGVRLDRDYVEADKRILVGFIEPHFFAGFSGGSKAIAPGICDIDTILQLHRYELIGDDCSTWGVIDGNPIQNEIHEIASLCPPDFLVNVTLNSDKQITGVYAGDCRKAHEIGCSRVRETSMVGVDGDFDIVVTSNSGYPLDQNLYQTVKGMSCAARVVAPGGALIVASECCDGIPAHGNFFDILNRGETPESLLNWICGLKRPIQDQWQVQVLLNILRRASITLVSELDPKAVQACCISYAADLQEAVYQQIRRNTGHARVAVLPEGPLTIPVSR